MWLSNMAESENRKCANLWVRELSQGGSALFCLFIWFDFMYIVQLYKEDWTIMQMLGGQAVALSSIEQIVPS